MYPKFCTLLLLCILTTQNKATRNPEPFTCVGKVIGGYYTDVLSGCQMFHVCTLDEKGELQDIVFRCIDGTVFEQETRVCEREEEVNCADSENFFYLNNELYGPGIIPDTANDNSFKTAGQVMTLNWPVKRVKDFQPYMTGSNHGFVHVSRPTSTWSKKIKIESSFSSFSCNSKSNSGFFADEEFGCNIFHLCIELKSGRLKLKESYICSQNGAWFNEKMGKCMTTPSKCGKLNISEPSNQNFKEFSKNRILAMCKNVGHGGLIPDLNNNCSRYYRCNFMNGVTFVESYNCPTGLSYSTKHKACKKIVKNGCKLEYASMRHLERSDTESQENVINIRVKRNSLFENHEYYRKSSSGSLSRASGIFSDHASVIDNPSPGNIVIEGSSIPNKDRKEKFEVGFSTALTPQASHARNSTLRNGTVVEVSELSSPDQNGKVTITSIVPKFVRLNGNTQRVRPGHVFTSGITVSSFQSKVTLSGVNAKPKKDESPITEITDMSINNINETSSDNETELESDILSTNEPDANLFTVIITTPETTPVIEEITKPTKTETTASTTNKSTLDTKLSQDEIIETNFTCRDKELERFYPDIEAECKVFHYCAPGFSADQVLDLKFLCTGNTRFDSTSSKCQNTSEVSCEIPTVLHGLTTISPDRKSTKTESSSTSTTRIPSTSMSTSTQESTTVSTTSASTQISTQVVISSSTSTSTFSSTTQSTDIPNEKMAGTDTVDKTAGTDTTEKISSTSVTQSAIAGSTVNPVKPSNQKTISAETTPGTSEIFTPSIATSEGTPTSKVLTDENNTHVFKADSTDGTTNEMLTQSTINAEKSLLSKQLEENTEDMSNFTDQIVDQILSEEIQNENLTFITDIFENEENETFLLDIEENVNATSFILDLNTTNTNDTEELEFQTGSTPEEINATHNITFQLETSTSSEIANETILEVAKEQITDMEKTTGIEIDMVTKNYSSTNNNITL